MLEERIGAMMERYKRTGQLVGRRRRWGKRRLTKDCYEIGHGGKRTLNLD